MAALHRLPGKHGRRRLPAGVGLGGPELLELAVGPQVAIPIGLEVVRPAEPGRLDRLEGGQPAGVVPVTRRLRDRHQAPPLLAELVRVRLDDLQQLAVAERPGELHDRIRGHVVQARPFLEAPMLLGVDQLQDVHVGMQPMRCLDLRDLGIHDAGALLPGERHAVVTVDHEVQPTRLVDGDRRHRPVAERLAQSVDALLQVAAAGAEEPVEVHGAVDRTDDRIRRDLAHPHEPLAEDAEMPLHVAQGKERLVRHWGSFAARARRASDWR